MQLTEGSICLLGMNLSEKRIDMWVACQDHPRALLLLSVGFNRSSQDQFAW
jgi:hypothetical protein